MHRIIALALACAASPALAQTTDTGKDGYELFIQCDARHAMFNQGVCLGYLGGVIDAHSAIGDPRRFCVPDGEPLSTIQDIYIDAYEARRLSGGTPAAVAVATILGQTYPCEDAEPAD